MCGWVPAIPAAMDHQDHHIAAIVVVVLVVVVRSQRQPPARTPHTIPLLYFNLLITVDSTHRAQSGLIRRDTEFRIFGYFSYYMHARIISERDFQTIHLKIITHKKAFL